MKYIIYFTNISGVPIAISTNQPSADTAVIVNVSSLKYVVNTHTLWIQCPYFSYPCLYNKMAHAIDFALNIGQRQCFIEIEIDFKHNFCCKINLRYVCTPFVFTSLFLGHLFALMDCSVWFERVLCELTFCACALNQCDISCLNAFMTFSLRKYHGLLNCPGLTTNTNEYGIRNPGLEHYSFKLHIIPLTRKMVICRF